MDTSSSSMHHHEALPGVGKRCFSGWSARTLFADRMALLGLLRAAGPLCSAGLILTLTSVALAAPAAALAAGRLVHTLASGDRGVSVVTPLLTLGTILVGQQVAEALSGHFAATAARRIDGAARRRVREIALAPCGIGHMEQEAFQTDATRAGDQGFTWRVRSAGTAVTGQVVLIFRFVGAIASALVLASYFPFLALGLLVTSILIRRSIRRHLLYLADVGDRGATSQSRARYWADLTTSAAAGKEIRLFALADWVLNRRLALHESWVEANVDARRRVIRSQASSVLLVAGSALAAMLVPGLATAAGRLSAGGLATCLAAAWGVFLIGHMGFEAFDIEYGAGAVRALAQLDKTYATSHRAGPHPEARRRPPQSGLIRLDQVSFGYPNAKQLVLDQLTLQINPGEVLAIVGANGAGKSTLTKLLAGLYEPTAGTISNAGIPLAELDMEKWRRQLTVVTQNFVHYPASLVDNVALSVPEQAPNRDVVQEVLTIAGLYEDLASPLDIDALLWKAGSLGTDLSGGQWQKLAVARALYASRHGRRIIVLDEPTSHLDVRAEADFYDRVVQEVSDCTVVLISHRLSTVRRADRIAVLSEGRIAECGSHERLLRQKGQYARLFQLQASRFTGSTTPERGATW